jgi:hypothetical protein
MCGSRPGSTGRSLAWCLATEGDISCRRIKFSFGLEELRRELIGIKRPAADVDGELLL